MSFRTSSYCAYPSDCIEIGIIDAPRKSSFSHTTGAVHCVEIATSTARKSTFSPNGEPSCVEVVEGTERKSSYSATGRPECIETADGLDDGRKVVVVRDTKQDDRRDILAFGTDAWGKFASRVRAGAYA